jgi:hypothetical protein
VRDTCVQYSSTAAVQFSPLLSLTELAGNAGQRFDWDTWDVFPSHQVAE